MIDFSALRPFQLRCAADVVTELHVDGQRYQSVLAADLDVDQVAIAAASQRPITASALEGRPSACAWRTLPCWSLVPVDDRVLDLTTHRRLADRADARAVELPGSYLVPVTRPDAVAALLGDAIAEVS